MKIICVTRAVPDRMHVFRSLPYDILKKIEWVVHDVKQRHTLRELNIELDKIHVTGIKVKLDALVDQRDWLERQLLKYGEWYIGLDDNIQAITRLAIDKDYAKEKTTCKDRSRWKKDASGDFIALCNELRDKCVAMDTSYGGFEYNENPFFRQSKWKLMGYVRSKLFVKTAQEIKWRWHKDIGLMHDHAMTFRTMAERGCVIHNRFVYVHRKMWEKGGLGTKEERMPARIPTCERLYKEFPGFVVPNPRTGEIDDPVCRLRGLASMKRWREANGYL